MSYDVSFLRVGPGESLDDAYARFCEMQEAAEEAPAMPSVAERQVWVRIAEAVRGR